MHKNVQKPDKMDEKIQWVPKRQRDPHAAEALQFASAALRADKEIVMKAVTKDGLALQFAGEDLQLDREVVTAAVQSNKLALQYAHEELRRDADIRLAAGYKAHGRLF